jgi:hypothetical protein
LVKNGPGTLAGDSEGVGRVQKRMGKYYSGDKGINLSKFDSPEDFVYLHDIVK